MTEEEFNTLRHQLVQTRAGGAVQRCHGIKHLSDYSNSKHQWGVAHLMWLLWPEDFGRLGPYCLFHDTGEFVAGDVPATTMRYAPGVAGTVGAIEAAVQRDCGVPLESTLDPEDYAKLKACDRLELYVWCREELLMGNHFVHECMTELARFFQEKPLPDRAMDFYNRLQDTSLLPTQAGVVKRLAEELKT